MHFDGNKRNQFQTINFSSSFPDKFGQLGIELVLVVFKVLPCPILVLFLRAVNGLEYGEALCCPTELGGRYKQLARMILDPFIDLAHGVFAGKTLGGEKQFFLEHFSHHLFAGSKPFLKGRVARHFGCELDDFGFRRDHCCDFESIDFASARRKLYGVDLEFLDAFEALLDVLVDFLHILAVAKEFEQVVIAEEVESREVLPLSFEELVKDLLAFIQLATHIRQILEEAFDAECAFDVLVLEDAVHVVGKSLVHCLELADISEQLLLAFLLL
jgi:hypothetical protein